MNAQPDDTCWTVLRRAATGDEAARSVFSRSYALPIRDYLESRWRGSPLAGEVDDATQEVFIECIKSGGALERVDPARGFRGFLYGVVRNIARRFEERAPAAGKAERGSSVCLDDLPGRAASLSRMFDRVWARSLLAEAVHRHAAEARARNGDYRRRYQVLQQRHDEGLPVRDIAARLGEPDVGKVHNEYRRARREFRAFLREVVATHTGTEGSDVDAECQRLAELLGT